MQIKLLMNILVMLFYLLSQTMMLWKIHEIKTFPKYFLYLCTHVQKDNPY